jgi:2',3'-cyclic-nucleotide 2'-phosphodiesterase (5'-nucleotidase family)
MKFYNSSKIICFLVKERIGCLLLLIILSACAKKKFHVLYQSAQQYSVTENATETTDSAILHLVQYYKLDLNNKMQEAIVRTDVPLSKAQPESTMGNWIADVILQSAQSTNKKVIASIINYGSIGIDYIAPGTISRADFYKIIPFDNKIVIVSVQGSLLKRLCDTIAQNKGWPVSGISFVIDSNRATKIKIDGVPLNDNLVYNIATNNFLVNAGAHVHRGLLKSEPQLVTGISVRTALINYCQTLNNAGKQVHSSIENRISYAE